MKRLFFSVIILLVAGIVCEACTSAIVAASRSASGRPILWKNRDTGADNNFLARVEPTDSTFGFIGLFNAGDSALSEAWMGMNDAGFAIMNTASYNLAPDTAAYKDREGAVMAAALARCRTVADFYNPVYETPEQKAASSPDLRTTIYWNPSLRFDGTGKASVLFYTSDDPESYRINIEGVTKEGYVARYSADMEQ